MSIWEIVGDILFVFLFVFLNGFFVAAEFAIVKIRATQLEPLEKRGNARARIAREIVSHLDAYLSATQLGITMTSLALGWLGEPMVASMIRPLMGGLGVVDEHIIQLVSFAIAFSIITFLHIVLGELTPKSIAIQKTEMTTLLIAYPLRLFFFVFKPIINTLNNLANAILRMIGIEPASETELMHSEEELRLILAREQGVSASSRSIVLNAMDFRRKQARHIMVPRKEMLALSLTMPVAQSLEIIRANKFSRFPVYKDSIDNIVGVVMTKDIFKQDRDHQAGFTLASVLRDVCVLPETATLEKTLETMQQKKTHMVVLADEYGGTAGLVTLELVLEELVGSIQDEYDREAPEIVKVSDDEYLVDGSLTTNDVERLFNIELSPMDIRSIGGYAVEQWGHIPSVGETFEAAGLRFTAEKIADNAVETVRILRLPPPEPEVAGEADQAKGGETKPKRTRRSKRATHSNE
ncbi:MAG: hemolysin family protein [Bacteroidetes bacterium]|nr:hemolysin family protein [Bacteroidota bacterium]